MEAKLTERMSKSPPFSWTEWTKTVADEYKKQRDPHEMEVCKVTSMKPLTSEEEDALVSLMERYLKI